MNPKKKCKTRGCKKPYYAKGCCATCYMRELRHSRTPKPKQEQAIDRSTGWIRASTCCGKECVEGMQHDCGKMYCPKCKRPCMWKWDSARRK